jgi:hypothetical protein
MSYRYREVAMLIADPHLALTHAHERIRHLREESAAERLGRTPRTRRALAASLRRLADRLDPARLAPRPA